MDLLISIIGWAGALMLLCAFTMLSMGRWQSQQKLYIWFNIFGGLLLGVDSFWRGAWPAVTINWVWSLVGILSVLRKK